MGGKPTVAALEELCQTVSDLPAGTVREGHLELLARLKDRVDLAHAWEAAAVQLLGDSPPATLEQLQVPRPLSLTPPPLPRSCLAA